jgi:hypothetical protein
MSFGKTAGNAAYFDYLVYSSTGRRAGTVIAVWDENSSTHTDYSTVDLNDSTGSIEFNSQISGSNFILNAIISSGNWSIKVGARII